MNRKITPHVSALVSQFIPEHVRERFPKFVEFVQAYLNFLETTHKSGYFQNTIQYQRDIELQEEQFLREIEKEIGLFVPVEWEATPRVFYNKISELWRSKGSEEAIETFFRLFLKENVQVRYPWDKVLKPSDGRWITEDRIRVSIIRGNPKDFLNQRIRQIEEYGVAFVSQIERKVYADDVIYELTILREQTSGTFVVGNRIELFDRDRSGVLAEIYKSVNGINILDGGSGYRVGDRIRFEGRSKSSFEARVTSVSPDETRAITSISIIDFGSGNTPNHIKESRGIGSRRRFYFEDFNVFFYLEEEREQRIGETQDLEEVVNALSYDYTQQPDYYTADYVGDLKGSHSDIYPVLNSDVSTDPIILTPTDDIPDAQLIIITENGEGAVLEVTYGAMVEKAGHYSGVYGQLSESIVLQDSYFYQRFSYEIVSQRYSIHQWIDPLKRTVHPAGTIPFALVTSGFTEVDVRPEFVLSSVVRILMPVTNVTAEKKIRYTMYKVLKDSFGTETEARFALAKRLYDTAQSGDEGGTIYKQSYVAGSYFYEDYVGSSQPFGS